MRYGFVVPFASELEFIELAELGEEHGWDAVFSWEGVWRRDAWVQLAAAAARTQRIRLGTVITPASRYRPWDLASLVSSVDQVSQGRVTLGVGLGALNSNWTRFEGEEPRRDRARKLDECLEVFSRLTSGEPFSYDGEHYSLDLTTPVEPAGPPPSVQRPHPPVWPVGAYVPGRARQRSLERAARWQGVFPAVAGGAEGSSGLTLDALGTIVTELQRLRADAGLPWEGYDVVVEGDSHGDFGEVHGAPQQWADAGATWWVESWWDVPDGPDGVAELRRRVQSGPPRA
ncbi:LLM class flavin-dependent oxidoreductase [Luteipulveratus sp. YIM 133132]|uniref:LLM class flavin-dependent oxidoreductase n=1 Tax=Luteipulveratus flavus TaxID=3031728 RepID=UPI0023B18064|nr:LLM class flavin-dependent oxidoreductase [Luteipulveratus sp. YIM 133132]MDE9365925.1 LLM class flavin-dependent oxidoreductase [Luteipulveratus sp. YIM 133132]